MYINVNTNEASYEPISPCYEVDSGMAKIISTLNKKGYSTFMCCSGHLNTNELYTFILFNNPPKFDYLLNKGWKVWKNKYNKIGIYKRGKCKEKELRKRLGELRVWVGEV